MDRTVKRKHNTSQYESNGQTRTVTTLSSLCANSVSSNLLAHNRFQVDLSLNLRTAVVLVRLLHLNSSCLTTLLVLYLAHRLIILLL